MVKVHRTDGRVVVALCDNNLIGQKFESGDLRLDITERFYKGEQLKNDDMATISNASSLNVVGKESVGFALKHKLINKENIIKVGRVPYAIALL